MVMVAQWIAAICAASIPSISSRGAIPESAERIPLQILGS